MHGPPAPPEPGAGPDPDMVPTAEGRRWPDPSATPEARAQRAEAAAGRTSRPRVLLVESDRHNADLMGRALGEHFGPGSTIQCHSIGEALAQEPAAIDLVLTDMNLPEGTGLDLLNRLLQRRPDLPVVLLTGEGVLDNALEAIRRGAYDYVVKSGNYLFAIPLLVEKNLAVWRTKQENARLHEQLTRTLDEVRFKNKKLEEAVQQLATMAATDPLTTLANRRAFNQALQRSFAEATRYQHDLACIMIDLDSFKQFNDTLGHQGGDELLQRTARVLEANCRRSDIAGRFGGDEFSVLLPQTDMATAEGVARRVHAEYLLAARALLGRTGRDASIGMSMGVASLRRSRPASPEVLISHADRALYRAKQSAGRSIVCYVPERFESASGVSVA